MTDDLNCTCFRLRRADRQLTRLYDAALAEAGIGVVQFSVLAELARSGPMGVTELGDRLGTERTTLTRTLERMQAAGWIAPQASDDQRLRRHAMTDAGRRQFAQAASAWRRVESAMARAMGTDRLELLWQLLGEARQAADQVAAGTAARQAVSGRRP